LQATRRLRGGVLVTGIVYRHPAVLANMAATIDHISGGRLELGLGAGWNEEECGAYGIALGSLRERFDRFDEALEVITGLLEHDTTTFHGRYFNLNNARCNPLPVQRPRPPICIGGGGEQRTLRSVARWADHWNWPGGAPADFARKRDVLYRRCAEIGRDPGEITTSTHLRLTADTEPKVVADDAAAFADAGLDLGIVYLASPHTPAVLEPLAETLQPLTSPGFAPRR
jgi:alkanesulfonate monooxygenase SsuD/methylene tetrahydromethanopterin reductase-like flavin-dependent oxidoreductase (luciferase family)